MRGVFWVRVKRVGPSASPPHEKVPFCVDGGRAGTRTKRSTHRRYQRSESRFSRFFLLCFLLLSTSGCTEFRGEATVAQCSDAVDNDSDQLVDCEDPDCRATSLCGQPEVGDAPLPVPPPASTETEVPQPPDRIGVVEPSPPDLQEFDAHVPMQQVDADASIYDPPARPDAGGPEDDPPCIPSCASDETCVAGQCRRKDVHRYLLRLRGAETPRHRAPLDLYDTGLTLIGPWYLNSVQDIYAAIVVNGQEAARTDIVQNDLTPTWTQRDFELEVTASDRIEVILWDYDGELGNADLIFRCEPPLLILPRQREETFRSLGCEQTTSDGRLFAIDGDALMLY